jgi:hypothetical protein
MSDSSFNIRVPKKWVRMGMVAVVTALIVAPLTAHAIHDFTDVPDSNTFHEDISAIADAGVTLGCNPPDNDEYCPKDNVTREQMAAFMNRLGALGPGKTPVVNAATVDGKEASDLMTSADSTFNDGPITTDFNDREVIRLDLSPGSYVILATAWLDHGSGSPVTAECTLTAGVDFDQAREGLEAGSSLLDTASVSMTVVHTFDADGSAILECDELEFNADLRVWDAKITAIAVGGLSNLAG